MSILALLGLLTPLAHAGAGQPKLQYRPANAGGTGGEALSSTDVAHAKVANVAYRCVPGDDGAPMIAITAIITNTSSAPRPYTATAVVKVPGKCVEWMGCTPEKGVPAGEACPGAPCIRRKGDAIDTYNAGRVVIPARSAVEAQFLAPSGIINSTRVTVTSETGTTDAGAGSFAPCPAAAPTP